MGCFISVAQALEDNSTDIHLPWFILGAVSNHAEWPLIQSSIAAFSDPDDLVQESSTVEEYPRCYIVETPTIQLFDRYEFSMVRKASTVGWRNNGVPALN